MQDELAAAVSSVKTRCFHLTAALSGQRMPVLPFSPLTRGERSFLDGPYQPDHVALLNPVTGFAKARTYETVSIDRDGRPVRPRGPGQADSEEVP